MDPKLTYEGHDWFLAVTRNMSFWHQCNSNYGLYHHTKDFGVDAKLESLFITVDATKCSWFTYSDSFNPYSEKVMLAVDSIAKVDSLKNKYELFGKDLLVSMKKVSEDLTLQNWDDFISNYRKYCAGLTITTVIGRAGSDILVKKLKSKDISESDISNIISKITFPAEYTPLFQSSLDLMKIGQIVQTHKMGETGSDVDIDKELGQWLEKYSHIPVNFCDEPWSMTDAKAQLDSMLQKNCRQEIERSKKEKEAIIHEAKAMLEKLGDESISTLAHAIAEGTYLNELRKNIFSRVSLGYRGIFSQIAKQCGSSNWRDCFYLTPEEMRSVIAGQTLPIQNLVAERKIYGAYTTTDGGVVVLPADVVKRFHSYVAGHQGQGITADSSDGKAKEIKGFSASRGCVKGVVRIILDSKDFARLAPGDILVTTMTSVDFVPIMERAAAFVTNEGGITSHASIVAREMNKPCIIGTKNATQVLKDGDTVEVDANRGIVRILNK